MRQRQRFVATQKKKAKKQDNYNTPNNAERPLVVGE